MKNRQRTVILAGIGLYRNQTYTEPFRKMGFTITGGTTKARVLELLQAESGDILLIADTMSQDRHRMDLPAGRQIVKEVLKFMAEELPPKRRIRTWVILSRPGEEAEKELWRFGFVIGVLRRVNPRNFALHLACLLANAAEKKEAGKCKAPPRKKPAALPWRRAKVAVR